MNLQDFSLLKEDAHHYTVGHPAGKTLEVPKKGLSDKAHGLIKGLKKVQNFAEGTPDGTVQPEAMPDNDLLTTKAKYYQAQDPNLSFGDATAKAAVDIQQRKNAAEYEDAAPQRQQQDYEQSMADLPKTQGEANADIVDRTPAMAAAPMSASAEMNANQAANTPAQTTPAANPPNPLAAVQDEFANAAKSAKGRIEAGFKAEEAAGGAESKAYQEAIDKVSAFNPQQALAGYQAKDKALEAQLANSTIDPDRYLHNMDTGSKIAAGIGIMLGGIGQGFGQGNMAMDHIKNAITQDVEAQKNDQSKSMNLWKMNREMMKNDQEATLATQNQLLTIAKFKVMKAQASASGAMSQAKLAPAIQALDNEIASRHQTQTVLGMMNQPGQVNADPSQLVPYLVSDPKAQTEVIKEINDAKELKSLKTGFEQSARHLQGMIGNGTFSPHDRDSAINAYTGLIQKVGEGRYNEEAAHAISRAILPDRGDTAETVLNKSQRRDQFFSSLFHNTAAKAHNIDLERFGATNVNASSSGLTPDQQKYYDWAKANPKHPKAELVFKQLGMQ